MAFFLFPLLLFIVFATWQFVGKPHFALSGILIASVFSALLYEQPIELGVSIYAHDIVFIPLFICALYRVFLKGELASISILWIIYGLLLFYQVFIGITTYGTPAAADFRTCFYYWTGGIYFMSFQYTEATLNRLIKYWLNTCLILLALVYFRLAADVANLPMAQAWRSMDAGDIRFRVINGQHTYLLGVAVVMLFHKYLVNNETKRKSSI